MNRRLAEHRIRSTCRELLARGSAPSGRALRRELLVRFGAVGKTERVFQIWREECAVKPAAAPVGALSDMAERLRAAETAAAEALARAERAEMREEAHQSHWAMEIDRLREQLRAQPKYAAEIRKLTDQVLRLAVELQAARVQLAQQESSEPTDSH